MRLLVVLVLFPFALLAEKHTVVVEWSFSNVKTGFDYANKVVIYVDGEKQDSSGIFLQSAAGICQVEAEEGLHSVRVECMVRFEGEWELYSKENDYAIDAVYELRTDLGTDSKLKIDWDINGRNTKASFRNYHRDKKKKEEKITCLEISWTTLNLNEGFDFQNMCIVFVDGRQVGYSGSRLQSQEGEMNVKVSRGRHTIVIENYVYTGKWELQSKMNDYATDAFTKIRLRVNDPVTIHMTFDIAEGTTMTVVN